MKTIKSQKEIKKVLYILRGPSGSGKSTLAKNLGVKSVFSADDYFMEDNKYVFDSSKLGYVHGKCKADTREAMEKGISPIAVDNTFTTRKEIFPYAQLAELYGYSLEFIEPDWTPELKNEDGTWNADFIERQQKNPDRVKMNKSLPRNVVDKMINRYQYDLTPDEILANY